MRGVLRFGAPVCAALLLAACGGGGGGSSSSIIPVSGASTPPISQPVGGGTSNATLSISVHPFVASSGANRKPQYVAPTTLSATFQVTSVNGTATPSQPIVEQDLTATSPGCSGSGATVTCSISYAVPIGNVLFSVKTYDHLGAAGTQIGTATAGASIIANNANRLTLTVSGVIAAVQLFLAQQQLAPNTAARSLLIAVPQDANGNVIVNPGNYDKPIALSVSGGGGHVGFEANGARTPSTTATVASPNDQMYVTYDGAAGVSGAVISASAAETPVVNGSVSLAIGTAPLVGAPNGAAAQNASFVFSAIGNSGTVPLSGGSAPYNAASSNTSVATASVSNSTVTVNAVNFGTAQITVSDAASHTFTIPVSVNAPAIGIAVQACGTDATCTTGSTQFNAIGTKRTVNLTLTGGTGTFTYAFGSTGSTLTPCATAAYSASGLFLTASGACSDLLVVSSGNQSAYYALVQLGGAATTTLSGFSHAYSPSANQVVLAPTGALTVSLSAGNGPWSATTSGCSGIASVTASGNSAYVIASTGTAYTTGCSVSFVPTIGTAPAALSLVTLAPLSATLATGTPHAPGDTATINVSGAVLGALFESFSQAPNLQLLSSAFGSQPESQSVNVIAILGTGTNIVNIRDTALDQSVAVPIVVDNANAQLPGPIGLLVGSSSPITVPAFVTSLTTSGVQSSDYSFSSGIITANPSVAGSGTLILHYSGPGTVSIPITAFGIAYSNYAGSIIGAASTTAEAFPGKGLMDTVNVSGPASTFQVFSSAPGVVSVPSGPQSNSFTAISGAAGFSNITIIDSNGASYTYVASVTSVTIPVLGKGRVAK